MINPKAKKTLHDLLDEVLVESPTAAEPAAWKDYGRLEDAADESSGDKKITAMERAKSAYEAFKELRDARIERQAPALRRFWERLRIEAGWSPEDEVDGGWVWAALYVDDDAGAERARSKRDRRICALIAWLEQQVEK